MNKSIKKVEKCVNQGLQQPEIVDPMTQFIYLNSLRSCRNCKAKCDFRREQKFCLPEQYIFIDLVYNLKKELKELGIKINFSNLLLIKQTAMLIIRLGRAQQREGLGYLYEWDNFYPKYMEKKENLFDIDYIAKLEKRLTKHLKLLGLLPEQVIVREKIKIVEKLKKQLFKLEKEGQTQEVDAVCEKEVEL